MKRYGKMNPGGVYDINEFYDTVTYNLYAKTCKGEVIPPGQKLCMGVRCDNWHA